MSLEGDLFGRKLSEPYESIYSKLVTTMWYWYYEYSHFTEKESKIKGG